MLLIKFLLVDRMFDECGAENGGGREVELCPATS
jgi:hypothetical protein